MASNCRCGCGSVCGCSTSPKPRRSPAAPGSMSRSPSAGAIRADGSIRFKPARRGSIGSATTRAQFLASIWTPGVVIDNQIGPPQSNTQAVSAYADGGIVLVERFEADFRVAMDMSAFPFDRQQLTLSFSLPRYAKQDALLVTTETDRLFSRVDPKLSVIDWRPLGLTFFYDEATGWNARSYSRLNATVEIERLSERYLLRLFIPILSTLAVSLFVLWIPGRVTEGPWRPDLFGAAGAGRDQLHLRGELSRLDLAEHADRQDHLARLFLPGDGGADRRAGVEALRRPGVAISRLGERRPLRTCKWAHAVDHGDRLRRTGWCARCRRSSPPIPPRRCVDGRPRPPPRAAARAGASVGGRSCRDRCRSPG